LRQGFLSVDRPVAVISQPVRKLTIGQFLGMKTAGSIEIIGGKARRRSRGRVDHTLRFKTAEIIRAIVGQFEQGGTDGLENQQIFKAPEVQAAGGLNALIVGGKPRELLAEAKRRMFAV